MSRCHTRGSIVGARKRPYFLTFSFIFARFGRFACFGRFGGFVAVVSAVSLVSVVSLRPFRFVVSGFSTCRHELVKLPVDVHSYVYNLFSGNCNDAWNIS